MSLNNIVVDGLDTRACTVGVFLNLTKASTVRDRRNLLAKLESHGIRFVLLKWLGSYVSHRIQNIQILNKPSKLLELWFGVPQGSNISPFVFLIYVNDDCVSLQR